MSGGSKEKKEPPKKPKTFGRKGPQQTEPEKQATSASDLKSLASKSDVLEERGISGSEKPETRVPAKEENVVSGMRELAAEDGFATPQGADKADPMEYFRCGRKTFSQSQMPELVIDDYRAICDGLGELQKTVFIRMFRDFARSLTEEEMIEKTNKIEDPKERAEMLEKLKNAARRASTMPDWVMMAKREFSKS